MQTMMMMMRMLRMMRVGRAGALQRQEKKEFDGARKKRCRASTSPNKRIWGKEKRRGEEGEATRRRSCRQA